MIKAGLCTLLLLLAATGIPAQAFDSSGLADEACFHFYMSGLSVTSGKATSKTSNEYYFSASTRVSLPSCDFTYGPVKATIWGRWDASTGEASEQISHGAPSSSKFIVTHTRAKCPKDPWQNAVSCTLISQSNTHPGSDFYLFTFLEPFPVTAGLLSASQRKILATTVTPFQDFTLIPTTPPVIVSPAMDVILRNGVPVIVQVRRPLDGSESWYAGRSLQFEVQFEVHKDATASKDASAGGKPIMSLGPMWTRVSPTTLLGTATLSTTAVSVPLATFAAQGPGSAGDWQSWHMRVRLADPAGARPWSGWQAFYVVVPTTFIKAPGAGGLPSDLDKAKASSSKKGIAPSPTVSPTLPILIQPQTAPDAAPSQHTNRPSPPQLQRGTSP